MKRASVERRQHPRFLVWDETGARMAAVFEASLLNISRGGALLEHTDLARPGTLSSLVLNLHGKKMTLRCRTVRSAVHRVEVQPDGERTLIYHTGLEFLETSEEAQQIISHYIESTLSPNHISILPSRQEI